MDGTMSKTGGDNTFMTNIKSDNLDNTDLMKA